MTTALLIIDMQHFFLDMTTNALPKILTLIDHFKSKSLTIIFTQHGHSKEELTPPFKNQIVKKWGPGGSLATGSRDWEFITEIGKEAKGGIVVAKNTYARNFMTFSASSAVVIVFRYVICSFH